MFAATALVVVVGIAVLGCEADVDGKAIEIACLSLREYSSKVELIEEEKILL